MTFSDVAIYITQGDLLMTLPRESTLLAEFAYELRPSSADMPGARSTST
jgi:hypothetical protein